MNIDEFLSLRGTDISAVMTEMRETVGLGTGDVLLAVGSIVEGLGTSKSDLDLMLITPRDESSLSARDSLTLVVGRCLIDVRLLRLSELDELLKRFETWARLPWNVTHAVKFSIDERTLLHRLLHGRVLHKGKSERVTRRLPARRDVACLKLHIARQMSRTIQVDMVGYREVGDYRSLVFAAQEVLGHAVDALTAGYQLTNPLIKWRSRMLDFVPPDWERSLALRPNGLSAGQQVWRLHRAPERPDKAHALTHAFRVTTFARAVFMWAELQMVDGSAVKLKPASPPRIVRGPREPPLPCLDFDVDFFIAGRHVTAARLNEFDETLEMTPREFALALLFDGTTTAREAELLIYGSRRGKNSARTIERLVSRVTQAGLSFPPQGGTGAGARAGASPSRPAGKTRS